jgi:hypothetical protein
MTDNVAYSLFFEASSDITGQQPLDLIEPDCRPVHIEVHRHSYINVLYPLYYGIQPLGSPDIWGSTTYHRRLSL